MKELKNHIDSVNRPVTTGIILRQHEFSTQFREIFANLDYTYKRNPHNFEHFFEPALERYGIK